MTSTTRVNLIVVAHPDDEVLGFGGTGVKLIQAGEIVQPVILCGSAQARTQRPSSDELFIDMLTANETLGFQCPVVGTFPNLRMNTVDHIEIVKFIEQQIVQFQPTRLFTHHPGDLNNDHVQTAKACLVAARLFQRRTDIRSLQSLHFIEILSSTDWAFPTGTPLFTPDTFEDIESTLSLKLKALAMYRNVKRLPPHPRSVDVITGHASYRGGQSGFRYAEAFQTAFRRGI